MPRLTKENLWLALGLIRGMLTSGELLHDVQNAIRQDPVLRDHLRGVIACLWELGPLAPSVTPQGHAGLLPYTIQNGVASIAVGGFIAEPEDGMRLEVDELSGCLLLATIEQAIEDILDPKGVFHARRQVETGDPG